MNKSSAMELYELMERGFFDGIGYDDNSKYRINSRLFCCMAIAETFKGVNSNLSDSWMEVGDTCSKLLSEIWNQIEGVFYAIGDFCYETSSNEQTAVTATQKTNEASEQALRELGLKF